MAVLVKVKLFPEHIAPPLPIEARVGAGLTETVTEAVLLQPAELAPVTV